MKIQRGSRLYLCALFKLDSRWGAGSTPRSFRFTPGKETR